MRKQSQEGLVLVDAMFLFALLPSSSLFYHYLLHLLSPVGERLSIPKHRVTGSQFFSQNVLLCCSRQQEMAPVHRVARLVECVVSVLKAGNQETWILRPQVWFRVLLVKLCDLSYYVLHQAWHLGHLQNRGSFKGINDTVYMNYRARCQAKSNQ